MYFCKKDVVLDILRTIPQQGVPESWSSALQSMMSKSFSVSYWRPPKVDARCSRSIHVRIDSERLPDGEKTRILVVASEFTDPKALRVAALFIYPWVNILLLLLWRRRTRRNCWYMWRSLNILAFSSMNILNHAIFCLVVLSKHGSMVGDAAWWMWFCGRHSCATLRLFSFSSCLLACLFVYFFVTFFLSFSQDSPRGGGLQDLWEEKKSERRKQNSKHPFHHPRRSTVRNVY